MTPPRFPTVPTAALRLLLEDVADAVHANRGFRHLTRNSLEIRPPGASASALLEFDLGEVRVVVVRGGVPVPRGAPVGRPEVIRGIVEPADSQAFLDRVLAALRRAYAAARDLG